MARQKTPTESATIFLAEFLTAKEFARLLSISKRTLFRLRAKGRVPEPVEVSTNIIRWRACDIQVYLDGLKPRRIRRRRKLHQ